MNVTAIVTGLILVAGLAAVVFAASPAIVLLAKLAIAISLIVFAAAAIAGVMRKSFTTHALRSDDFHWQ